MGALVFSAMPFRIVARVAAVIAAAILLPAVAPAAGAASTLGLLLDSDDNASTGCTVAVPGGSVAGVDLVVTAHVATSPAGASVARVERQSCNGASLAAPVTIDGGGSSVGAGRGTAGTSVVEIAVPRTLLPASRSLRAIAVAGDGTTLRDATSAFAIVLAPLAPAVVAVPLSPWLVPPLALALLVVVYRALRRRPDAAPALLALVLVGAAGLAWAATVIRDGNVGDWTGVAAAVTDPRGDAPIDADLVAVFHQQDAANLYVRFDVDIARANQPPTVSAGTAQTIRLPAAAALSGTATDDGLPDPPGTLTATWTKVSGAGSVTFANPATAATTATFSAAGAYVLRLSASDGAQAASADVTITVLPATGGQNQPPTVSAGPPQSITLPAPAALAGSVTDDGLPGAPSTLTSAWTLVSGPASVAFADPASPTTTATFAAPGSYLLRLAASDGAIVASSTVAITVADGAPQLAAIADRTVTLGTRYQQVLQATDGNALDALTYALDSAPGGAALAPAPLVDWVPTASQLGTHAFTARVTDVAGRTSTTTFRVTVVRGNRAPVLATQGDATVAAGSPFTRTLAATDADGDPITLALVAAPAGMTLTAGALSWNATATPGTYTVTVRASDPDGAADTRSFSVRVLPAAQPTARPDRYAVQLGATLTVPPAGVLANDAAAFARPLSAARLTDPAKGTLLAFDADGGFTYRAPATDAPPPFGLAETWRNDAAGQHINTFPVIGDVNGDGRPDLVLSSQFIGHRAVDGRTGATLWNIDTTGWGDCRFDFPTTTVPLLADVDDDGTLEYVGALAGCERDSRVNAPGYAPADRIFAIDASTGRVKWATQMSARIGDVLAPGEPPSTEERFQHVFDGAAFASMAVARFGASESPTILYRRLVSRGESYYQPVTGPARSLGCRGLTGRAEDDGRACRTTILMNGDGTVRQMLVAPNPTNHAEVTRDPWRQAAPFAADLDGDGVPEIVSGSDVWKRVGGAWTLAWQSENEPIQALAADLDGDGKAEVIHFLALDKSGAGEGASGNSGGSLFRFNGLVVLDGDTGAEKWRIPLPYYWTAWLTIADVDSDGEPDFVINSQGLAMAMSVDGRIKWTYDMPAADPIVREQAARSGIANVQVYDLDGDGVNEVVTSSYAGVVVLDGRTGKLKSHLPSAGYLANFNTGNNVQVADFDGDGHADILVLNASFTDATRYVLYSGAPRNWLPGPKAFHQANFIIGDIADDGHVRYNPVVPTSFRNPKQLGTVADPRAASGTSFSYTASDGVATSAPADVFIELLPANRPPVITSTPPRALWQRFAPNPPGGLVTNYYDVAAYDPDAGDTITYSLPSAPGHVTIDPATGRIRFEPTCGSYGYPCPWGWTYVTVRATDSRGAAAEQSFMVNLDVVAVAVPDVTGLAFDDAAAALRAVPLGANRHAEAYDVRPAGTVLAQRPSPGTTVASFDDVRLTVSKGPRPVDVPYVVGQDLAAARAALEAAGLPISITAQASSTVPRNQVTAQSPAGGTTLVASPSAPVALTVSSGAVPAGTIARIVVEPGSAARLVGDTLTMKATAVFADGTASDVTLNALWTSTAGAVASVDAGGRVRALTPGTTTLRATVGTVTGTTDLAIAARSADATAPTAAIASPADGADVSGPVTIAGTAADARFHRYELSIAPAGESTWTVIAEGTSPVTDGALGTLDPATLANDLYTLRLTVTDRGGNTSEATSTVQLRGDRKPGLFALTFVDLQVPMAGLPITVSRTYDSRDKAQGDFGVGWRLGLSTLRLRTNRALGTGWVRTQAGFTGSLVATAEHKVSLVLPDGRVEEFDMAISPTSTIGPLFATRVTGFTPRPGTQGRLAAVGNTDLLVVDDGDGSVLVDDTTLADYDPQRFVYTTVDGLAIEIDRRLGVTRATDANGNTLTFARDGITHSSGTRVAFVRDADGRIVQIVDPLGHVQAYGYDANGDLVSRTDANGAVSRYAYDRLHNLIEARDPVGNRAVRNDYDDAGRLVSTTDALGNTVSYAHDTSASREVVRDRLGNVTVYGYDAQGNVTSRTDPLGRTWTTTFDARGNALVVTDPLGRAVTRSYDARDNLLTETDADGDTRRWTYDSQNRVLTAVDADGRTTTHGYDGAGNLVRVDDPQGGVTRHAYDGAGRRTSTTDPLGRTTTFGYDGAGNLVSVTDPLGHATTFAYDASNRRIAETDPLGNTTRRVHDAAGRVVQIVDAAGGVTSIAYSAAGDGTRPASRTDALGRVTRYDYDALGRLVKTTHPDGTTESVAYDAEGRETSRTDRAGATTRIERDALGRPLATTFADGTTERTAYDAAGRAITFTDARGHVTTFTHAPKQLTVTDPLGGATIYAYDGARRPVSITDALGRVTRHAYDSEGNLLATTYADGTTATASYDAARQATAHTDQAGRVTRRDYDAAGRLVAITDPSGATTGYGYDAAGRRTSERDANGHGTQLAYDALGRLVSRTRPGGQQERFVHDAAGNLASRTDFAGRQTTFAYDAMDRLVSKTLPGGIVVAYAYDAAGRRTQAGGDRYQYDLRGRLVREQKAGGAVLTYRRDDAGNVTSFTTPDGTTTYTYDARNRIATVAAGGGTATYAYDAVGNLASLTTASGIVTTHAYDLLGRLVQVTHARGGSTLASYAYTLGPAGDRVQVVESGPATAGRTVRYSYDAAQRLLREAIDAPGQPTATTDYAYDGAGNRTRRTRGAAATDYAYDANDRLLSQTTGGVAIPYAWDANGNLASRGAGGAQVRYFYDAEDRLTTVSGPAGAVGYAYDADGLRISRAAGGTTTDYVVDKALPAADCRCLPSRPGLLGQVVSERTGGRSVAYTLGHALLARTESGSTLDYLRDGTSSMRHLVGAGGAISDAYSYDAFGESLVATGATRNAYRYAGESLDEDTGLYDLRARSYDPALGRFLSADPEPGHVDVPATLHRYIYAANDPIDRVDPSGRDFTLPSLTVSQAVNASLGAGFVATLGARATGYARDWSEALSVGAFVTAGTLAILVPYSYAVGGELAVARSASSAVFRSNHMVNALHYLNNALTATTTAARAQALRSAETLIGNFIQQAFRSTAARCVVVRSIGGVTAGLLVVLNGVLPGNTTFAPVAARGYELYGELAASLIPGLAYTFGCP